MDPPVLGPVSLRVVDRDRALSFWRDLLGCAARERADGTISLTPVGGERELLRLVVDPGAPAPPPDATGLFHVALLLPDRAALARALLRIEERGGRRYMVGASDHLVSEALYYYDEEGNGLELYADRSRESWRRRGGELAMATDPLDLRSLVATIPEGAGEGPALAPGTVVGHVHLKVGDLERTGAFYQERLGMDVTVRGYPGALFLSWAGYHHHLGTNVWGARARVAPPAGARGLMGWEVRFSEGPREEILEDPDGVEIRVLGRAG
jgi:catechol 2,3-dioxygenase